MIKREEGRREDYLSDDGDLAEVAGRAWLHQRNVGRQAQPSDIERYGIDILANSQRF